MPVNLKEFMYNEKPRKLYELVSTADQLGGIEVSAMSDRDSELFLKLVEDFQEALKPFMQSYYRRFDPKKVQSLQ